MIKIAHPVMDTITAFNIQDSQFFVQSMVFVQQLKTNKRKLYSMFAVKKTTQIIDLKMIKDYPEGL